MLPGPTTVDPRVLQAMAKDVVNHRGDEFGEIYTETSKLMSKTFKTKNDSYIITGSGTAAMEAAVENCVSDTDKVLVINGGTFGHRFCELLSYHNKNINQ